MIGALLAASTWFIVIPEKNAFGLEDDLLVFQTGILSTEKGDFQITTNFDIRTLKEGNLIRMSGITVEGYPYYVFQKMVAGDAAIYGKVLVNGKFVPIIYKEVIPVQTEEVDKNQTELADVPAKLSEHTFMVLVSQSQRTIIGEQYRFAVKIFEENSNPTKNFNQRDGVLQGVKIDVSITNQAGNELASFSGETDATGKFAQTYLTRQNSAFPGKYNVQVVATYQNATVTQQINMFFDGYVPL